MKREELFDCSGLPIVFDAITQSVLGIVVGHVQEVTYVTSVEVQALLFGEYLAGAVAESSRHSLQGFLHVLSGHPVSGKQEAVSPS